MTITASNILLGVNVDHCATVRQARFREHALDHGNEVEPDPEPKTAIEETAAEAQSAVTGDD